MLQSLNDVCLHLGVTGKVVRQTVFPRIYTHVYEDETVTQSFFFQGVVPSGWVGAAKSKHPSSSSILLVQKLGPSGWVCSKKVFLVVENGRLKFVLKVLFWILFWILVWFCFVFVCLFFEFSLEMIEYRCLKDGGKGWTDRERQKRKRSSLCPNLFLRKEKSEGYEVSGLTFHRGKRVLLRKRRTLNS